MLRYLCTCRGIENKAWNRADAGILSGRQPGYG